MEADLDSVIATETALLVMDFQPGIIGRIEGADKLLARVEQAISVARNKGAAVGYVRVALTDEDKANVPAANKSFSRLSSADHMQADAPETQVHDRLEPQPGDIEVRKIRVGAFSTTDLNEQLCSRGIKNLILSGISTSGVILSTTRDAADKDYRVFILSDGVADADDEVHRVLLEKVFPRQAHVIKIADLPDLLR